MVDSYRWFGLTGIEDVDKLVKILYSFVISNKQVMANLVSGNFEIREMVLEKFVEENMERLGINELAYEFLFIQDQVFYELQEKEGLDFGFCKYFLPKFKDAARIRLTNTNPPFPVLGLCNYNSAQSIEASCWSGRDQKYCVLLHPEIKDKLKDDTRSNLKKVCDACKHYDDKKNAAKMN